MNRTPRKRISLVTMAVAAAVMAGAVFLACTAAGGRTGTVESDIAATGVVVGDQAAGDVDKSLTATLQGGSGGDSVTSMLLAASALCGALGGGGAYPFIRKLRIRMAGDPLATLRNRVEILERLARKDGHL